MATSGSVSTNKYSASGGTMGLKFSWSVTSQSIVNNTTTIHWTLKSEGSYPSGSWIYAGPVTCTVNGSKVVNTTSRFKMYGDGSYSKSGNLTIAHSESGEKTFSVSIKAAIYSTSVNCTGSKSFTLNKINRYALINTVQDFNDELTTGYPTITYSNPAGTDLVTGLKVRIKWTDTSQATQATQWVSVDDNGGSYTFSSSTLTAANIASMLAACPTTNGLAIQFEISSILGGTEYTHAMNATMNVVNANPMPGAISVAVAGNPSGISSSTIVQKQSTLTISSGVSTPQKSAAIASYVLSIFGQNYTLDNSRSYVFIKPTQAGTFDASIITTDSRGNTATVATTITIVEWSDPAASYTIARVNGFETATVLTVNATYSSINNQNVLSITEKHRIVGDTTWSSESSVTNNTATTLSLNFQNDWEVMIKVADKFSYTEYRATVGRGIPTAFFDVKRHSFGVNGFPDADEQLYVGGQIKCESMYVEDISSQYTITKTSGNANFVEVKAHRSGNVVCMQIMLRGAGSNWTAGSNIFVGTVEGPPPTVAVNGCGYYDDACFVARLNNSGGITFRWLVATKNNVASSQTIVATLTFITDD